MQRIVVGVDGSAASSDALKLAAQLGRALADQLVIVHVKRPILIASDGNERLIESMRSHAEQESKAILEKAVAEMEALGASGASSSLEGPTSETLVDIAEAQHARLLVVGSRGRGAVARMMMGSVADRTLHLSKVPVLVVR